MFSLIITVISIALAVVLTVATVMYLGDRIKDGRGKIAATTYMNAGEIIRGAVNIFKVTNGGRSPESVQDLVDAELLSSIPEGEWALAGGNVVNNDVTEETCERVNEYFHGVKEVLICADMPPGKPGCCSSEAATDPA